MTLHADIRDIARTARGASAAAGDRKFVTALAHALKVLRAFAPSEGPLGHTGLLKPTISRLTYALPKLGRLADVDRLGSDIGPRLVNLRNVEVDLSGH